MNDLLTEIIAIIARGKPEEFFANACTPEEVERLIREEINELSNLDFLKRISEALNRNYGKVPE